MKADRQIKVTEELLDNYKAINAALTEACGLALKQPITGRQYVLMTDASFRGSGYALKIEDDNDKKNSIRTKIMHVAVTQNTSADFLSRIDLNPKERVDVKIRDDITIRPIQVNLQSTDVADEEQIFSFKTKLLKLKKKSSYEKNKQDKMHATKRRQK